MTYFPLFTDYPDMAYQLMALRAIEVLLLVYYMRGVKSAVGRTAKFTTLIVGFICYTVIYEARTFSYSFHGLVTIHILHLLIWDIMLYILYRLPFQQLLSINLILFLLLRASRWLFATVRKVALKTTAINLHFWAGSYFHIFFCNLLFDVILILMACYLMPPNELRGDKKSNTSLVLLAILFIYVRYNINDQNTINADWFMLAILSVVYLFTIIMTFVIIRFEILYRKNSEQNQIMLLNETKYHNALTRLEAYSSVKRIYHDIHKHLTCIASISGDNEKILDYVESIHGELSQLSCLVETGNDFLNSILSERIQQGAENDVQIVCDVDMHNASFIKPLDLCAIFGNAVDNAYEAAVKVKEKNKRLIKIKAKTLGSFLAIRISNYYDQVPEFKNGEFVTSKPDLAVHGYGMSSIRHSIKRYNGTMEVELLEPKIFVLKILIPLAQ